VRTDPGQVAFRPVGESPVQLVGDRQPEDAVAEELETLVRVRPIVYPRGMRESRVAGARGETIDQLAQRAVGVSCDW
jgi:hypothetical protein